MHAASPVTVTVVRPWWLVAAMVALWTAGAMLLILWLAEPRPASWREGTGITLVLLNACLLMGYWACLPRGTLGWNGADWDWTDGGSGASQTGKVVLCLDLQYVQLLRFISGQGPTIWLWLDRTMVPGQWDLVRRAIRSPADHGPHGGGQVGVL
jgi:hypothetical protein